MGAAAAEETGWAHALAPGVLDRVGTQKHVRAGRPGISQKASCGPFEHARPHMEWAVGMVVVVVLRCVRSTQLAARN
jgi:hypothetical protein